MTKKTKTIVLLILFSMVTFNAFSQEKLQPMWWFGLSGGANFNFHSGEIQSLNTSVPSVPEFKKGFGMGLFMAPLLEYRPHPVWGGMITIGFDGRGGKFDDVNVGTIKHSLETSMNYISVEPSLRITPFYANLYFFAGPRLGFNVAKSYTYDSTGGSQIKGDWSNARGTAFGGQIGVGYDIGLTNPDANTQIQCSPYLALHLGQGPRSIEKWSLTTLRAGIALKFGSTTEMKKVAEREVSFSVKTPKIIPVARKVQETFPLRNYIFFDEVSTKIPSRYVQLLEGQANSFKSESLIEPQPTDLTGRSGRQLTVYYNTLNIFADRLRNNHDATIQLNGSSDRGAAQGKAYAESIKDYFVNIFGINPKRIITTGSERPSIPTSQPGGTRELDLVKPEDRRVEITSNSLDILAPIEIISFQEDPIDSYIIFTASGAEDVLASWMVEVTDQKGITKNYGPFTSEQERISGKEILGAINEGLYKVELVGQTKGGQIIRKEENIRLVKAVKPEDDFGLRYSILFEFDQSKTVATYDRFLSTVVAPLIPDGGSVIIHGHTDIVGEESHNLKLSRERSRDAMQVIERELGKTGKKRVKFDTYGFGEDVRRAPFENRFPEERFYNRTVIIEIVPE